MGVVWARVSQGLLSALFLLPFRIALPLKRQRGVVRLIADMFVFLVCLQGECADQRTCRCVSRGVAGSNRSAASHAMLVSDAIDWSLGLGQNACLPFFGSDPCNGCCPSSLLISCPLIRGCPTANLVWQIPIAKKRAHHLLHSRHMYPGPTVRTNTQNNGSNNKKHKRAHQPPHHRHTYPWLTLHANTPKQRQGGRWSP